MNKNPKIHLLEAMEKLLDFMEEDLKIKNPAHQFELMIKFAISLINHSKFKTKKELFENFQSNIEEYYTEEQFQIKKQFDDEQKSSKSIH